jgi:hypothetical protein
MRFKMISNIIKSVTNENPQAMETATLIIKSDTLWFPVTRFSPLLHPDIKTLIRNIKHSRAWVKGDQNAMFLVKHSGKQVVLAALHSGTDIYSYQSNDSITFQIIEGSLRFNSRKASATIAMGQVLTLNGRIKYRLTTSEETVLLLSVAKNTLRRA